MQDRYTGDIGDYVKYGLLRAVTKGKRLGVAWYLFHPGGKEKVNADGGKVRYLNESVRWRDYDPELFDFLQQIVNQNKRKVSQIEKSGLLGSTRFSNEILEHSTQTLSHYYQQRYDWRLGWFDRVQHALQDCDVVFADPDNGLCEDDKFKPGRVKDWKRLPFREAKALAENRTAIIYHHNTRRKGGHRCEIAYWIHKLGGDTLALYCYADSSFRTFYVINPLPEIKERLYEFAGTWPSTESFTIDTSPSLIY